MALIYRESGFLRDLQEDSAAAYIIDGRLAVGNTSGSDNWALSVAGNVYVAGSIMYFSSDIINLGDDECELSGTQARTLGSNNFAAANNTIALGFLTVAGGDQATSFGFNTVADGAQSVAMGTGTSAVNADQLAIGRYNGNVANSLFSVGMGTSDTNRKDAFRVSDTGLVYAPRLSTGGGIFVQGPVNGPLVDVTDPSGVRYGMAVYSNSRTQVYGVGNVSIGFNSPASNVVSDRFTFTSDAVWA